MKLKEFKKFINELPDSEVDELDVIFDVSNNKFFLDVVGVYANKNYETSRQEDANQIVFKFSLKIKNANNSN